MRLGPHFPYRVFSSVVVGEAFEEALVGAADGTAGGRFLGLYRESAAAAVPFDGLGAFECLASPEALEKSEVTLLVHLLNFGDVAVEAGDHRETFLLGSRGEGGIEVAPFFTFAGCGLGKVGGGVGHDTGGISGLDLDHATLEQREELLGMAELLIGGGQKYGGDLLVAFLSGFLGKECVTRTCLAFTGKRCQQIMLGLCASNRFLFHNEFF